MANERPIVIAADMITVMSEVSEAVDITPWRIDISIAMVKM